MIVKYRYFNYATKQKAFETYEDARKFWNFIRVQYGIRYAELVPVVWCSI